MPILVTAVQSASLGSVGAGASLATGNFVSQPTVGNYLVAWAWGFNAAHVIGTIVFSDTGGNVWVVPDNAAQVTTNDNFSLVGYAKVVTTGANFNVTVTPPAGWGNCSMCICAQEFSVVAASSPQDGVAIGTAPGTTAQSFAPGSMPIGAGGADLVVLVNNDGANPANLTSPVGWTSVGQQLNGLSFSVGEGMYRINAASPVNPTWTTTDVAVLWGSAQMALAPIRQNSRVTVMSPSFTRTVPGYLIASLNRLEEKWFNEFAGKQLWRALRGI